MPMPHRASTGKSSIPFAILFPQLKSVAQIIGKEVMCTYMELNAKLATFAH